MLRLLLWSLLLSVLGGCATPFQNDLPVTDLSHEQWAHRQHQLEQWNDWHLLGRVALFVKDDVYNLGLNWRRHGQQYTLKLEAALGQGMVQLRARAGLIELQTSEGESFGGQTAEQVLTAATGWALPVEGLLWWIKGINHPNSDYLPDIDTNGRARSLQQDGWRINYLSYQSVETETLGRIDLPQKLYLKRDQLALKIVIDQWQGSPAATVDDPLFEDFPALP